MCICGFAWRRVICAFAFFFFFFLVGGYVHIVSVCVSVCAYETLSISPPPLSISHVVPDPRGQQLTFLTARGYHKVITTTALVFIDTQNWGKGQRDPSETAGPRKEMVCHSIKIYYLHQAACNRLEFSSHHALYL